MIRFAKTFWCDDDGLSITDFLSSVVILSFAIINIITCIYLIISDVSAMEYNKVIIDHVESLNYPVYIVLSGYFGKHIVRSMKK